MECFSNSYVCFHVEEAERIRLCKGRIFALKNEPEVARDFGLISVNDVSYDCLSEKDGFVILATDGVRH